MEFLTLTEAAQLTGKSIQTIRRMIKRKRIQVKRQKTPQGFNYLVDRFSLENFIRYRDNQMGSQTGEAPLPYQNFERKHAGLDDSFFAREIERFTGTIEKLVSQHEKDKENFFQLIKNFQDRIQVLEGQIKLLEAPKKRWWQIKIF